MFNPADPAYRADPAATYRHLHAGPPLVRNPNGVIVVTRHADVAAALADRRRVIKAPERALRAFPPGPFRDHNAGTLAFMDPPDHTRVRRSLAHVFTLGAVAALEPSIERHCAELLDELQEESAFDLMDRFAQPLTIRVICEMLGAPPEQRVLFRRAAAAVVAGLEPGAAPDTLAEADRAVHELSIVIGDLLAQRRNRAGHDVLALLAGLDAEDRLTPGEVVNQAMFLLNAGHETTTNLIGNGVRALFAHPQEQARLRRDPSLYADAIDELLRFDPPLHFTYRRTAEPLTLAGEVLAAGSLLLLVLAAANRDPEVFEHPDALDIARPNASRHLAFAAGPHTCLGANLARLEGRIALQRLFERFPELRPATAPMLNRGPIFQGLADQPVATKAAPVASTP